MVKTFIYLYICRRSILLHNIEVTSTIYLHVFPLTSNVHTTGPHVTLAWAGSSGREMGVIACEGCSAVRGV